MRESGSRPEDRVAVGFVQRRLHGKGAVPIDCRGAAEVRQAFQHQHALTFPGERCASGEPAEARPDDDCIPRSAVIGHRSLSFMAVTSAAPGVAIRIPPVCPRTRSKADLSTRYSDVRSTPVTL